MKNIKLRIFIYAAAFIVTAALTYIFAIEKPLHVENKESMSSAGLPVLYMTTESGISYNYLHGYASDADELYMHNVITPIGNDRKLSVFLKQYGCVISGISYEIRSIDGSELIERTDVSDYSGNNGVIKSIITPKNLIENNREYMLKIIVSTEKYGNISYYTRIIMMENSGIDDKLAYVLHFSDCTFSADTIGQITAKLETDRSGDNTNLGRVNIHCKQSQIGFASLNPSKSTDTFVSLNEIDGNYASITLNYGAVTDDSVKYNIKEFYRINQVSSNVTYVYNFDRWMDQCFDVEKAVTSNGNIYLGISSDNNIEMATNTSGSISCFVRDNTLWSYKSSNGKFTQIFSFAEEGTDGIRENYDQHGIKILNVDDKGNVEFVVYGYMNRGLHEGCLGISLYKYSVDKNETEELIFLPRTESYKEIQTDIDTLAYVNDNNIMYIYMNGAIYYVDYSTKEYMMVADKIVPDVCKVSNKSKLAMYQTGNDKYQSNEVNILKIDSGEIFEIKSDKGDYIYSLGFIDGNAVYGLAHAAMLKKAADGSVFCPMYKLVVINENFETVREYEKEGIFITGTEFTNGKINISRAAVSENGVLTTISDDQLLSNLKDDAARLVIDIKSTDARQKEEYIKLAVAGSSNKTNVDYTKYVYSSDSKVYVSMSQENIHIGNYYVYGFGCEYLITKNLCDAISAANESGGVVVDSNAQTIWTRYKSKSSTLTVSVKDLSVDEIFANLTYNLTGCPIELALYFVNKGQALLANMGNDTYVVVYGYSQNNVNVYTLPDGTAKTYTISEFNNIVTANKRNLIVIK